MARRHSKKSNNTYKYIKVILLGFLLFMTVIAGSLGISLVAAMQAAPKIDPDKVNELMSQTSEILDQNGKLIEKVDSLEYRAIVDFKKIPKYMGDAFIAVEDERFYKHNGVDPIGIIKSTLDNIKARRLVRGASTLSQQLARNLYLSSEKKFDRKAKEAYLAMQLTKNLGKEGVLEAYMNRVFLGQSAYGVQAASETYFSKNVENLTIAEAATLAGIVKSPTSLALYRAVKPSEVKKGDKIVGDVILNGELYKAVFNPDTVVRQKYVLEKMYQTGKITKQQYEDALKEDISAAVKPGSKKLHQLSSYYSDLVHSQVINKLMTEKNYTEQEAKNKLVNGGLKIYAAVDQKMQKQLEDVYANFREIPFARSGSKSRPNTLKWSSDSNGNITNENNIVIYFKKANILNSENKVVIPKGQYTINSDKSITFSTPRLRKVGNYLDPIDYYTINGDNHLMTHSISSISIPSGQITSEGNNITLSKDFVTNSKSFYSINKSGDMIINSEFYTVDTYGVVQPQSSTVVIEQSTGLIRAIIGGRDQKGQKILNRASSMPRQPGSTMKPIATYTPALDNGYTAATGIDDVPFYDSKGQRWPNNWYHYYKGLVSLRYSVEDSINVNAVKTLDKIGIEKSKEYLTKFGIINPKNANADNFITSAENKAENDENLAAMGLGAMTRGLTNLSMTGAYAAIANSGTYLEPMTFTKVLDSSGQVLLENVQVKNQVVSPQVAYVMGDILRTSVDHNLAKAAKNSKFDIAGKTGTTQETQDLWFVGYSPYYTIGTWLGFDNQQLKIDDNSGQAIQIWAKVNNTILQGYEAKKFKEPDGLVHETVCTISGKKPKKACYGDPRHVVRKEVFVKGTEPTEYCDIHISRQVNTVDGKLATKNTPSNELGYRTFIKRPDNYKPRENGNIYPKDWIYMVPGYSTRVKPSEPAKPDPNAPDGTTPATPGSPSTPNTPGTTPPAPSRPVKPPTKPSTGNSNGR